MYSFKDTLIISQTNNMKKSKILVVICVLVLLIVICVLTLKVLNKNDELPFAGVRWVRYSHDKEMLTFHEDGNFGYACSCGNPVDNSDVCETYTYDDSTKTITLDCGDGETEKIEIISYEEDELTLKFEQGTKVRTFAKKGSEREKEMEKEAE